MEKELSMQERIAKAIKESLALAEKFKQSSNKEESKNESKSESKLRGSEG